MPRLIFTSLKIRCLEPVSTPLAKRGPYAIVFFGFAACFIRFPGEWDSDTIAQHAQMLANIYHDWHPPVFVAFWKLLNTCWNKLTGMSYTGSGVIYAVHALMLWGGLGLLLRAARPFFLSFVGQPRWKLLTVLGALLFFGLFEMVPITRFVFKDTAMMAAYVLALGVMLNIPCFTTKVREPAPRAANGANQALKIAAFAFCLLLLFYGTAVRHNAIFALLPLLALLLIYTAPGSRVLLHCLAGLLVWAAILFGINTVNYDLLKAKKEYSLQEIIYVDYWKLNYKTKTFDPPPLPDDQTWAPLTEDIFFRFYNEKELYLNQSFKYIRNYYGGNDSLALRHDFSGSPEAFALLRSAWLDKISDQFSHYIKLHKKIFIDLLTEYSFMGFTGVWYLILGAAALIVGAFLAPRLRQEAKDLAPYLITTSALLYVLPYTAVIPDIQRRYLFWFFFASFIGLVWLGVRLLTKRAS